MIENIGLAISVLSGIVLIVMLCILPINHLGKDATVAANRERYKALTYKVESGACRDELGLLSKTVIDEIQEWNEYVVGKQTLQDNFWIGIFIPDIYDEFETIDYERYKW